MNDAKTEIVPGDKKKKICFLPPFRFLFFTAWIFFFMNDAKTKIVPGDNFFFFFFYLPSVSFFFERTDVTRVLCCVSTHARVGCGTATKQDCFSSVGISVGCSIFSFCVPRKKLASLVQTPIDTTTLRYGLLARTPPFRPAPYRLLTQEQTQDKTATSGGTPSFIAKDATQQDIDRIGGSPGLSREEYRFWTVLAIGAGAVGSFMAVVVFAVGQYRKVRKDTAGRGGGGSCKFVFGCLHGRCQWILD